jgi:uncharacterized membrane protein
MTAPSTGSDFGRGAGRDLDRTVARLLTWGTYLSVGLLAIGVVLMLTSGVSPFDAAPAFDPAAIPGQVATLQPVGFLWLGLIVTIATPLARVVASLVGYIAGGERRMAIISVAILVVIAVGVVIGLASER